MKASILSIGDELLLGQTLDTNGQWLAQQLSAVGCDIVDHRTVGDDQAGIERAIREMMPHCQAILITGGLGPTDDDLTRQAIAAVAGVELELRNEWLDRITAYFARLNRPMAERNKIQAMLPAGSELIDNPVGTACGMKLAISNQRQGASEDPAACPLPLGTCPSVFAMPGVPKEMKPMFTNHILPWIKQQSGGAVILQRTLHTFGVGESNVAEKLGDLMRRDRNPSVGTTVSNQIVSLRINARFSAIDEAQKQVDQTIAACRERLGETIYGQDGESIAQVVAKLLIGSGQSTIDNPPSTIQTVTTAESCTGGLLAKYLTDIPGSSAYFKQGFIVYSNKAKTERLGVSENIINVHGAVSEPVVIAMAKNARRLTKSDFALSISGIAGPDGGSPAKPVGTVCIALAHLPKATEPGKKNVDREDEVFIVARTFTFTGDREMIRDRAAKMALTMLRFRLLGVATPF